MASALRVLVAVLHLVVVESATGTSIIGTWAHAINGTKRMTVVQFVGYDRTEIVDLGKYMYRLRVAYRITS
jgi:hypothetical protein